jgi:uncharacterized protein YxeA
MKKVLVSITIVVLVLICGFTTFLLLTTPRAKQFEGRGVVVTLESDFKVYENENWDFYVENDEIAFMSNRFGKLSNFPNANGEGSISLKDFSLKSFTNFVLAQYHIGGEDDENPISIYYIERYHKNVNEGQIMYCYYTDANQKYAYMLVTAESDNFFYTINIACDYEDLEESRLKMLEYAISIEVE